MEKSIEIIWKEGFLSQDALIAPRLNNLYSRKSIHIVDRFKRMFKRNLNAIAIGSLLFLGFSFLFGIPVMGVGFFLVSCVVFIVNKRLSAGLEKIDKSINSYEFLKTFSDWLNQQLSINRKMARFYYPSFFLFTVVGLWFSNYGDKNNGDVMMKKLLQIYPDIDLVFGVPVYGLIGVIVIVCLLAIFGGRIYNWDVNVIYGRVFKKLEEIIKDMEDLQRE